jgi:hypothetical protein
MPNSMSAVMPNRPKWPHVGVLLAIAWLVTGSWMTRNLASADGFAISGQGASVLSVRAEYSTMSWREYQAAWLMWTPVVGPPLLARHFERREWATLVSIRPISYKSRARRLYLPLNFPELAAEERAAAEAAGHPPRSPIEGAVAARLRPDEPITESTLQRAAWGVLSDNLGMQLALIPLFAWRGASILIPLLLGVLLLRRREPAIVAFLAPCLYAIAFLAAITHFLPRYSLPMLPCALLALGWLIPGLGWRPSEIERES